MQAEMGREAKQERMVMRTGNDHLLFYIPGAADRLRYLELSCEQMTLSLKDVKNVFQQAEDYERFIKENIAQHAETSSNCNTNVMPGASNCNTNVLPGGITGQGQDHYYTSANAGFSCRSDSQGVQEHIAETCNLIGEFDQDNNDQVEGEAADVSSIEDMRGSYNELDTLFKKAVSIGSIPMEINMETKKRNQAKAQAELLEKLSDIETPSESTSRQVFLDSFCNWFSIKT